MFTMSTFSTSGSRNPAFRVMYLDPLTYLPLEWEQYFIDIDTAVGMYECTVIIMRTYNILIFFQLRIFP